MIVAVPTPLPVITPVEPTTPTIPVLVLQVPPDGESVSVELLPWHTTVVPVITDGDALTLITVVATQPDGAV